MLFALVGNQNCGKTTLFNRLTGLNQHVGNFPGVTVAQKVGIIRLSPLHRIADLPGVYSLTPFSADEAVTRDFISKRDVDGVINIADAGNLERGLFLTLQLLELGKPTVLALNMMDEVRRNGGTVNIKKLSSALGVPVIPISAAKNEGINALVKASVTNVNPPRFTAFADDNARYEFIEKLCEEAVTKSGESREYRRSRAIDRVLTHKYAAFPIFIAVMAAVFWLTFDGAGAYLSDALRQWLNKAVEAADAALIARNADPILRGFVTEGVLGGVVGVAAFLPVIILLFLFLSLLEDSGYMARAVFITDKPLRKIGLSGRSFAPLAIGFGCTVPAVMATRALPTRREHVAAIFLTPFMSCSAKIPVYALFTAAFFGERRVLVMFALYLIGVTVGVICACLVNKPDPDAPFIMELPNYRLPNAKSTLLLVRDKARDFLARAFTVVLLASAVIWFLRSFDSRLVFVQNSENSMLAFLGKAIAPVFAPLGFGDWRAATALITGFAAKETVISTLTVLLGADLLDNSNGLSSMFASVSGVFAFLTFTLLYTPCIAAISAVKKELGSWKRTLIMVVGQCTIAWTVAYLIAHPVKLGVLTAIIAVIMAFKKKTARG